MEKYEKEARTLAKKYGIKIKPIKKEYDFYFNDDKKNGHLRDVYTLAITSPHNGYVFTFGDSINESTGYPKTYNKETENDFYTKDMPTVFYTVFSCVQKYEVGSFKDFAADFGYNCESDMLLREARQKCGEIVDIYKAVKEEYKNFSSLFENSIIPDDILEIC